MLTDKDAEWIKNNRRETTRHRTNLIATVWETVTGSHPLTGEETVDETIIGINALVTEAVSLYRSQLNQIQGFVIEEGDLWVDIDIDDITRPLDEFKRLTYLGDDYIVVVRVQAGLGMVNRLIVVARRES